MRRSLSVMTLLVALVIVGCSAGASPPPVTPPPVTPGPATPAATAAASEAPQPSDATGSCPTEPVTIAMWDFEGETEVALLPAFEAANPCIKVDLKMTDYTTHHAGLLSGLSTGVVPDVAGIEVSELAKYVAVPEKFVNLYDLGAEDIRPDYLEWMWNQAATADQSVQIGVPIAAAGLAVAYRRAPFEDAGLGTDRDEIAALWPTWEEFAATGETLTADAGLPFVDSVGLTYEAIVRQGTSMYYNPDGSLIYDTNPKVKEAWDLAASMAAVSAKLPSFTDAWTTGIAQGSFAAMVAPSWMTSVIEGAAPDHSGQWDVAPMPGTFGNWGGSWLTIPADAAHPEEAWTLIKWILSPDSQLETFETTGALPATVRDYDTPAVQDVTNDYFNNAPTGNIYTTSLEGLSAIYEGPDQTAIHNEFLAGLARVEDGSETAAEAWTSTLAKVALVVGP